VVELKDWEKKQLRGKRFIELAKYGEIFEDETGEKWRIDKSEKTKRGYIISIMDDGMPGNVAHSLDSKEAQLIAGEFKGYEEELKQLENEELSKQNQQVQGAAQQGEVSPAQATEEVKKEELLRENYDYLSDTEFNNLQNPDISDQDKKPIIRKISVVNAAQKAEVVGGLSVKEYIDRLYDSGYRLSGNKLISEGNPDINLGNRNVVKDYVLLKESLQPVEEVKDMIDIPKTPQEERERATGIQAGTNRKQGRRKRDKSFICKRSCTKREINAY
jgi:hypothetical protein